MRRLLFILVIIPLLGGLARGQTTPATVPMIPILPPAPATGPAPLPTADEVRKQVDDGQYRDALKNLLRILDLKGPPAVAYDRVDMLFLRGECQLQIHENNAAQGSLDAAVKEARGGNGVPANRDKAVGALALSALLAKSPNLMYTPKTRTGPLAPKPISILDRT